MLGLGLSLNKLSTLMGIIRKGLQMWLGFTENTASSVSINSINLESIFASTVVGIVNPVVVEGPREISFDDTHFEQFNQEMDSVNTIYSQTYSSAYIAAGTIVTLSGNITQRDSTSTWNGLDFNSDGYLEFMLSTNTIAKVYIDAAHSVASDGLNIDATTGFFSVSLALVEGAEKFVIQAYDIQANDGSDPGPGVRISNLSLSSLSTDNVLGAELVVNGDFVSPTTVGWSNEYDSIFIVENNTLKVTAGSTGSAVSYTINGLTIGTKYNISWGYTVGSGALPKWRIENSDQSTGKSYSDVSNSFYFIPTATSVKFSPLYQCGIDGTFYFDNISVKEVSQFAPDKSTNSNNAKLFTGKALEFNGNDYVDLGDSIQGGKSVAFWYNTDTPANRTVLGLSSSYSTYIQVIGSVIAVKPPVGVRLDFNFNSLSLDTWYRVVVSVNSDNLVECYLDGIKSLDTYTTAEYLFGFNQIGRRQLAAEYWDGKLSDIQLYNAAWTPDDVTYDYANPNNLATDNPFTSLTLSNLSAYYALSEGSGNVIFDSTGLGAELVTNGDFSDGETGWNFTLPWSIVDNQATTPGTSDGVIQKIDQTSLVNGSNRLTFDIIEGEAQVYTNYPVFSSKGTFSTVGTHTIDLDSDGLDTGSSSNGKDNRLFFIYNKATNVSLTVDNVSVRLNKADDGTGAFLNTTPAVIGATWIDKQPTIPQLGMMDWSKGSNLITYSEAFNTYTPLNSSVVSNASYGWEIKEDAINAQHKLIPASVTTDGSSSYTASITAKANGRDLFIDSSNTNRFNAKAWFDLVAGEAHAILGTANIVDEGGGVYKCSITGNSAQSGSVSIDLMTSIGSTNGYLGDGVKGVYANKLQFGESSTLGSYIGTLGFPASNATLIQNPNDLGKDVLGNSLRLRDGGFNLDGSGYAEVADDDTLDFGTGDFSIECWAKFAFINKGSAWNSIACLGGGVYRNNSAGLATRVGEFALNVGNSELISTPTLIVGNWYHIVGTRTGSTTRLYIDSVVESLTGTSSQDVTNTLVKMIGDDDDTTTNHDRHYEDLIDDVRLYKNKALSQKEIDNNYKVGLSKHKN